MKKFMIKLLAAMLPMIIYVLVFIRYEPYNYFGFVESPENRAATPLARMREFMRRPSGNIILGDSRMNHIDLELAEQLSGLQWATLATGGQGANLTYALYEWAKQKVPVCNVMMDMSFYQVRKGSFSSSAEPVIYIAEHPFEYLVTRDYVMEAFANWQKQREERASQTDRKADAHEAAVTEPETDEKEQTLQPKYREELVDYAVNSIYPGCVGYEIGEEQMQYFINLLKDVKDGGGNSKVLCPVVQESIWEYVIQPLKLEPYLKQYKQEAAKYAEVYDMEWKSALSKNQDVFVDGFHFADQDTYQIYTRNLLGKTEKYVRKHDLLKQGNMEDRYRLAGRIGEI